MRYFMYKFKIQEYDWYESISFIRKFNSYMFSHYNAKVHWGTADFRELCEPPDSCSDLIFSRGSFH